MPLLRGELFSSSQQGQQGLAEALLDFLGGAMASHGGLDSAGGLPPEVSAVNRTKYKVAKEIYTI